jgi:RNA polymerase sigma-70 factor (TIGR02957 family)
MSPEESFVAHRSLLFTVAYELLGSAADAEDVVQEAWLRWADVDPAAVRNPRAYLVRTVSRQALNRLRTLSRRRDDYVGEWLPEPLLTTPDVAEDVELAESVSIAMLAVLESLTPTERAVFVLHEVFDVPYGEIADAVDKPAATVRQIAHRARGHVAARRPRVKVSPREQELVMTSFLSALQTGDINGLVSVMAPDVVLVTDGGGIKKAALRPIAGVEKVLRFLSAVTPTDATMDSAPIWVNGQPAVRIDLNGELDTIATAEIVNGLVTRLYIIRNPEKLGRLAEATGFTR